MNRPIRDRTLAHYVEWPLRLVCQSIDSGTRRACRRRDRAGRRGKPSSWAVPWCACVRRCKIQLPSRPRRRSAGGGQPGRRGGSAMKIALPTPVIGAAALGVRRRPCSRLERGRRSCPASRAGRDRLRSGSSCRRAAAFLPLCTRSTRPSRRSRGRPARGRARERERPPVRAFRRRVSGSG